MPDVSHLLSRNVRFKGTLLYGDEEEMQGNCRAVLNPVDPGENEVLFHQTPPSSTMAEALRLGAQIMSGPVEIEGDPGNRQYLFVGHVVNSKTDTQEASYRVKPQDLSEVEVTVGADEKEGIRQTVRFFLPPFDELAPAFERRTGRHHQYGFLHGWKPDRLDGFEEGNWQSTSEQIEAGEHSVEIGIHFLFDKATANLAEAEIIVPKIRVRTNLQDPVLPDTVRDVRQQFRRVQEELMPLWSALRFVLGRRAHPTYQELTTHDYENGAILRGRRFWNRADKVESKPGRRKRAPDLWELAVELVGQFNSLEGDDLDRAEKAVNRYVEAFEAPTAELKLTLLHSALHLILVGCEYDHGSNEIIPDDVPKPPGGGSVKWGLARFIGIHGIEWKDLFSDEVDHSEMYAFNRLRNDYLKRDRRDFLNSGKHVKVAQRLFERVFLAHHGIDPTDHPVLGS